MQFLIYQTSAVPKRRDVEFPYVSLYQDNWDDFGWRCRFIATLHQSDTEETSLGAVRIADGGESFRGGKKLPVVLEKLPTNSASLGESIAYYRRLQHLPAKLRAKYLRSMRDIVAKPSRRNRISDDRLWEKSFQREASSRHALRRGGIYIGSRAEEVPPPVFDFTMRLDQASGPHELELDFSTHDGLPNRTMLLIGRNGTGKTQVLSSLAATIMPKEIFTKATQDRVPKGAIVNAPDISRVITISYNAFDEFPLPTEPARAPALLGSSYRSRASYKYCGLRTLDGKIDVREIERMLDDALEPVVDADREDILKRILSTLLGEVRAEELTGSSETRASALRRLSAGQRLVAAIFTNIVGFIEEGSLLIFDEPETNLHPGLLTSVVAALNETLHEFDSYAVVATHSPILLQQVPSRYVRLFHRDNTDFPRITEPMFESFGEDLGELTRLALGLADPERDFTHILDSLYARHGDVATVRALFEHPLGFPAELHLNGLETNEDEL